MMGLDIREEAEKEYRGCDGADLRADERIWSNVYLVSLPTSLRSLESMPDEQKKEKIIQNAWLLDDEEYAKKVCALSFDAIVKKAPVEDAKSCDILFYDCERKGNALHYMGELKCTSKREMLGMLSSRKDDGIACKVRNSVRLILGGQLLFGGTDEGEDLVHNLHFFIVYDGKNNAVSMQDNPRLSKQKVATEKGRQIHASRQGASRYSITRKTIETKYDTFAKELKNLGLHSAEEDLFRMRIEPDAKPGERTGKNRYRPFSVFSSSDFKKLLRSGFFDRWNWDGYQKLGTADETAIGEDG